MTAWFKAFRFSRCTRFLIYKAVIEFPLFALTRNFYKCCFLVQLVGELQHTYCLLTYSKLSPGTVQYGKSNLN
jgi:hypothetical protein